MTQVLTVSAPRDLLALVPYRLGFTPSASVVLLCLRGPRRRVGLVERADLPPPGDALEASARHLVAFAVADGATSVLLVVYADEAGGVPGPGEQATPDEVLGAVREAAADHGVDLLDAWWVTAERYRSLVCREPGCCPGTGASLSELRGSVVSAEMVAAGRVVAPDRAALLDGLTPAPSRRRDLVAQAAARRTALVPTAAAARRRWRVRLLARWRRALASARAGAVGEVPAEAAGALLAGLDDLTVRDAVMLTLVPGSGRAPETLAAHGPVGEVLGVLDRVFGPDDAVRPDEALLADAGRVLRSLVRQGSAPLVAGPLGLLSWAAWWQGDGASARCLVERALEADADHRLAQLLAQALDRGVPPGWAQHDRALDLAGEPRT